MLHNAAKLEMSLLHAFHIVKVNFLCHGAAGLGDNLVVVLHLLALVHERGHLGLAAIVNENRGDLKDRLRVEVLSRIGHCDSGVDAASNTFQNRRVAFYDHIVSKFSHFLG